MSRLQGSFVSNSKINSIGSRIEQLRGNLGIGEFAAELGVNRKTVTRWVADETLPDGPSLLALKERFGADPGWVLTGTGEAPSKSSLTPDEQVLLDGYRALDPVVRRRMLAFMLGGVEPPASQAQAANTTIVTSHGGQAAGRDIRK